MHLQYITPQNLDALLAQDPKAYLFAVARGVASVLPVPASPIENPGMHFDASHAEVAEKIIGTFNEARPLDFTKTLEAAKVFWLVRYATLHDAADDSIIEGLVVTPSIFDLFGATVYVPYEMRDYLAENFKAVLPTVGLCIKVSRKMHAAIVAGE